MVICADNDKTSSNCRPNFATESTKIAVVLVCIGTARFRYCKQPTSFNNLALVESSAPNALDRDPTGSANERLQTLGHSYRGLTNYQYYFGGPLL